MPKRKPNPPAELRVLTLTEYLLAREQERADHSPAPGEPTTTAVCVSEILDYTDGWGTIRYGTRSQWNDGPVVETIDQQALTKIRKRQASHHKRVSNGHDTRRDEQAHEKKRTSDEYDRLKKKNPSWGFRRIAAAMLEKKEDIRRVPPGVSRCPEEQRLVENLAHRLYNLKNPPR